MEPQSAALKTIKKLIGQGELEQAFPPLVALLESAPAYAELLQVARIKQADLYQLKSQVLKGTIAADEARIVTNQITDGALQIISRLEAGKLTFADPQPVAVNGEPTPSRAWRYYVAGGIVALAGALIAFRILTGPKQDTCPEFGEEKTLKVLVLPFLKVGENKSKKSPEFDIALQLRSLFKRSVQLVKIAEADVKETYDIEKNYPNPAEALEIARECDADMIVWGRIDVDNNPNDIADVEYRLVEPSKSKISNDATINQLLSVTDQGIWHDNLDIISKQLYLIITNHAAVPFNNDILDTILMHSRMQMVASAEAEVTATENSDPVPMSVGLSAVNVTNTLLNVGDLATRRKNLDTAIYIYGRTLVMDPNNIDALRKRGALLFEKGDFEAAAQDFDLALRRDTAHARELYMKQIDAHLRSGHPDKAAKSMKEFRKKAPVTDQSTSAWITKEEQSIEQSRMAIQQEADNLNRQLSRSKRVDVIKQIAAARANRSIGRLDQAETQARAALSKAPSNPDANTLLVDVLMDKGDTVEAKKIISRAAKSGVRLNTRVRPLVLPVVPKQ